MTKARCADSSCSSTPGARIAATFVVYSLVLCVHAALLAWAAYKDSPVGDEIAHLPAGLSHWCFRRFDLYRVNPPLVRMIAALPVLAANPSLDWSSYYATPGTRAEFHVAQDFLAANGFQAFWYMTLARWACIPLSLLAAWVVYRWARDLFGGAGGWTALCLWCFSPNVLGWGHTIVPDVGAAAFGVTAGYVYWRWLKRPDWCWTLSAGFALGLAQLAKITWIVLFGLWPVVWIIWRLCGSDRTSWHALCREAARLTVVLLSGLFVLNLGYGFEGSFKRLGRFQFVSETLGSNRGALSDGNKTKNRFEGTLLARVPVPLPENYVMGIDLQKQSFELQKLSYLRGEFRKGGWWYYYLYALVVKVPLGTWLLAVLAIWLRFRNAAGLPRCRDEMLVLFPLVVVLTFVSANTGINKHLRYILPVFPFGFIWISQVGRAVPLKCWGTMSVAGLALTWSITSSLWVCPHTLSYFNELARGPTGGHAHLLNSNIGWGQDLIYLKKWLERHREAQPFHLVSFGGVDPRIAGIDFRLPARGPSADPEDAARRPDRYGPHPGWYGIEVNRLRGYPYRAPDGKGGWVVLGLYDYSYFLRFTPVAMAGYSIYIYHITPEKVNEVRRQMGLPELDDRFIDQQSGLETMQGDES